MSVHMFRANVGIGGISVSDLESRINDWITSNPDWEQDTVDHTLTERNTKLDGTGETYYSVSVRLREDDTKSNLLQKLADKLKDKVGWYRVAYHSCMHDQDNPAPCSWNDVVEWTAKDTTIPSGVPTYELG